MNGEVVAEGHFSVRSGADFCLSAKEISRQQSKKRFFRGCFLVRFSPRRESVRFSSSFHFPMEEEEERIVRNVRNPVSRDHKKEEDKGKRKKMGEEEEEEEAVCCRLDLLQRHREK